MSYSWCNKRRYCLLPVLVLSLFYMGCDRGDDNDGLPLAKLDDGKLLVDWLLYEAQEPGTEKYPVRMLASRDFLRFDDNDDAGDFLLLDRRLHTLFSVSHEERKILVIESEPGNMSLPANIKLTEERHVDADAPTIAGEMPVHITFMANKALCYEAVVVPGLLNGLTEALTEYAGILGRRQLNSLSSVPDEMQTPCFLSRYVYRPARHYREGLPVREWDTTGYLRTLVDYGMNDSVPRSLFMMPEGYERYLIKQTVPF